MRQVVEQRVLYDRNCTNARGTEKLKNVGFVELRVYMTEDLQRLNEESLQFNIYGIIKLCGSLTICNTDNKDFRVSKDIENRDRYVKPRRRRVKRE